VAEIALDRAAEPLQSQAFPMQSPFLRSIVLGLSTLALLALPEACTTANVQVGPGGSSGDEQAAVVVCGRLSGLSCVTTSQEQCARTIESGTCAGGDDAKAALLRCLGSARYDCADGIPTTQDCATELAAAACPSVPGTEPKGDGGGPAPKSGANDAGPATNANQICNGLCQKGIPLAYACTSEDRVFSLEFGVVETTCTSKPTLACAPTVTKGILSLGRLELTCDGMVDNCTQKGTWSMTGDKLNLDFTDKYSGHIVATCTKQ
jgi:hypothetical protein